MPGLVIEKGPIFKTGSPLYVRGNINQIARINPFTTASLLATAKRFKPERQTIKIDRTQAVKREGNRYESATIKE